MARRRIWKQRESPNNWVMVGRERHCSTPALSSCRYEIFENCVGGKKCGFFWWGEWLVDHARILVGVFKWKSLLSYDSHDAWDDASKVSFLLGIAEQSHVQPAEPWVRRWHCWSAKFITFEPMLNSRNPKGLYAPWGMVRTWFCD